MDDLDLVTLLRDDARPTDATVARHRRTLADAMRAASRSRQDRTAFDDDVVVPTELVANAHRERRKARALSLAAVVVLVGSAVAGAAFLLPSSRAARVGSASRQAACRLDPRVQLSVPAGYTGPVNGPSSDAGPLATGQSAEHWTGAHGSIEMRWPAIDESHPKPTTAPGAAPRLIAGMIGISRTVGEIVLARPARGECSSFVLAVYDADQTTAGATFNALTIPLFTQPGQSATAEG